MSPAIQKHIPTPEGSIVRNARVTKFIKLNSNTGTTYVGIATVMLLL